MSANVLADKDINTSAPNTTKPADNDVKSMEHHRQVLQSRLAEDGEKTTYISPSDMMMSPTTAKLADMRNKRFAKAKPQGLFGQKAFSNANYSARTAIFAAQRSGAGPGAPSDDAGQAMGVEESSLGEAVDVTAKKE